MKTRILQPEQIIVPGEYEIGNESILRIYFRIFDKGHGASLPPVIVVDGNNSDIVTRSSRLKEEARESYIFGCKTGNQISRLSGDETFEEIMKKIEEDKHLFLYSFGWDINTLYNLTKRYEAYKKLDEMTPEGVYYLIDGNHRTAAATLTGNQIQALELRSDEDLSELRMMTEKGDLFEFNRHETSFQDLYLNLESHLLRNIEVCRTVRQRVDELTSNGDLPKYMKERYLRG